VWRKIFRIGDKSDTGERSTDAIRLHNSRNKATRKAWRRFTGELEWNRQRKTILNFEEVDVDG
jgi:hypothetical protein